MKYISPLDVIVSYPCIVVFSFHKGSPLNHWLVTLRCLLFLSPHICFHYEHSVVLFNHWWHMFESNAHNHFFSQNLLSITKNTNFGEILSTSSKTFDSRPKVIALLQLKAGNSLYLFRVAVHSAPVESQESTCFSFHLFQSMWESLGIYLLFNYSDLILSPAYSWRY